MDKQFLPAAAAIRSGWVAALEMILATAPGLATARSSCSHPTLMQCLVLEGVKLAPETQVRMARSLLDRDSPIDEPLIAAASIGNVVLGRFLLDHGAAIDGRPDLVDGWTPLEESLYWGFPAMTELLLDRGATIPNLRTAAGLGRVEVMAQFFDEKGSLRPSCGGINSPFGNLDAVGASAREQHVLDNALSYAAMGGHVGAAAYLLEQGAEVQARPIGFHYRGTALHWAAIRGHQATCDFLLEQGADLASQDLTIKSTPAGWAAHGGHKELADRLA